MSEAAQAGRNRQLDALRALAIVLVVAIHASAYTGLDPATGGGWLSFLITAAGVPVFFLVDGFLFALRHAHAREFDYSQHIAGSARRLLVPWLVFSALYLAARAGTEALGVVSERVVLGQSWLGLLNCLYFSCAALQMYFLLSLFLIRCCAPLARRLAAGPETLLLGAMGAAVALHAAYRAWIGDAAGDPILLAIWGLQFYLLGMVLMRHAESIRRHRIVLTAASAGVVLLARSGAPLGALGGWVAQYAYLIALFSFFWGLAHVGASLSRIGEETMGIYLLHTPVLMNIVNRLAALVVSDPLLRFGVVTLLSFALALAASRLLARLPYGAIALGRVRERPRSASPALRGIASEPQ